MLRRIHSYFILTASSSSSRHHSSAVATATQQLSVNSPNSAAALTNEDAVEILSLRAYQALKQHKVSRAVSYLDECGRRYLHQQENSNKEFNKNEAKIINQSANENHNNKSEFHGKIPEQKKWESVVALWLAMMHLSALRDHEKGISFRNVANTFRLHQQQQQQGNNQNSFLSTKNATVNSASNSQTSSSMSTMIMATSGIIQFKVSLCADAVLRGLLRKLQKSANITYGHNHGLWHAFRNVPFLSCYQNHNSNDRDEEDKNANFNNNEQDDESILENLLSKNENRQNNNSNNNNSNNNNNNNNNNSKFPSTPDSLYVQALRVRLLYRALVDAGIAIAPDLVHHVSSFLPPLLSDVASSSVSVSDKTDGSSDNEDHQGRNGAKNHESFEPTSNSNWTNATLQGEAVVSNDEHQEKLQIERSHRIQKRRQEIEAEKRFDEELEFHRAGCDTDFIALVRAKKRRDATNRELLFCEVTSNNAKHAVGFENNDGKNDKNSNDDEKETSKNEEFLLQQKQQQQYRENNSKNLNIIRDDDENDIFSSAAAQFVERPAWWNVMKSGVESILSSSTFHLFDHNDKQNENVAKSMFGKNNNLEASSFLDSLRNIPLSQLRLFAQATHHLSRKPFFDWKELSTSFLHSSISRKGKTDQSFSDVFVIQSGLILHHCLPLTNSSSPLLAKKRRESRITKFLEQNNSNLDGGNTDFFHHSFALKSLLAGVYGDHSNQDVLTFLKSKTKRSPEQDLLLLSCVKLPLLLNKFKECDDKNTNGRNNNVGTRQVVQLQVEKNLISLIDLLLENSSIMINKNQNESDDSSIFTNSIISDSDSEKIASKTFQNLFVRALAVSCARECLGYFMLSPSSSSNALPIDSKLKLLNYFETKFAKNIHENNRNDDSIISDFAKSVQSVRELLLIRHSRSRFSTSDILAGGNHAFSKFSISFRISYLSLVASKIMQNNLLLLREKQQQQETSDTESTTRTTLRQLVDEFYSVLLTNQDGSSLLLFLTQLSSTEIKKFVRSVLCKTSTTIIASNEAGNELISPFFHILIQYSSTRKLMALFGNSSVNIKHVVFSSKYIPHRFIIQLDSKNELSHREKLIQQFGQIGFELLVKNGLVVSPTPIKEGKSIKDNIIHVNLNDMNQQTTKISETINRFTPANSPHEDFILANNNHNSVQLEANSNSNSSSSSSSIHPLRSELISAKKYQAKLAWVASLRALNSVLESTNKNNFASSSSANMLRFSKTSQIAIESCKDAGRWVETSTILNFILLNQKQENEQRKKCQVNSLVALETLEEAGKYDLIHKFLSVAFPELFTKVNNTANHRNIFSDVPLIRITIDSILQNNNNNNNNNNNAKQSLDLIENIFTGMIKTTMTESKNVENYFENNKFRTCLSNFSSSSNHRQGEIIDSFPASIVSERKLRRAIASVILVLGTTIHNNNNNINAPDEKSLDLVVHFTFGNQENRKLFASCAQVVLPGFVADMTSADRNKLRQSVKQLFFSANDIVRVISLIGSEYLIQKAKQEMQKESSISKNNSNNSNPPVVSVVDEAKMFELPLSLFKNCLLASHTDLWSTHSSKIPLKDAVEPRTVQSLLQILLLSKKWKECFEVLKDVEGLWVTKDNNNEKNNINYKNAQKSIMRSDHMKELRERDVDLILHRGALACVQKVKIGGEQLNFSEVDSMENKILSEMKKRKIDHWPSCVQLESLQLLV